MKPHSSDDLLNFDRLIICIRCARAYGGANIDGKFDERAGGSTNNVSSIEAYSYAGSCCTQRRPDDRGRFSSNVFQPET